MKVGAWGLKRPIGDVEGQVNENEKKRRAVRDEPEIKNPSRATLPMDLLLLVARFTDPQTYTRLFQVSCDLYRELSWIAPLHPEVLSGLSLDSLIWDIRNADAGLRGELLNRFDCDWYEFRSPGWQDWMDRLAGSAANGAVTRLQLIVDQDDIDLDDLLPKLEAQVAGRKENASGLPPSCELLLTAKRCNVPLAATLQAMTHLKITALCTPRDDWLPLLLHLPHLREISFENERWEKAMTATLASRTEPIPHFRLNYYGGQVPESAFFDMLRRLHVKHLALYAGSHFPLQTLNSCELESLQLGGVFDDEQVSNLSDYLSVAKIARLTLNCDDSGTLADLQIIADSVKKNGFLRRLDVRLAPDRVCGELDLLAAVLANRNIVSAALPYPGEAQVRGDRVMKAVPTLRIRRTNDYTADMKELDEICEAREREARSNCQ